MKTEAEVRELFDELKKTHDDMHDIGKQIEKVGENLTLMELYKFADASSLFCKRAQSMGPTLAWVLGIDEDNTALKEHDDMTLPEYVASMRKWIDKINRPSPVAAG
jgi:hypothetical protein